MATAALTVRAAFEDVYVETLPTVWRVVSARIPDRREAEDVTSDVFVRALQSWPRYDPLLGTPTAWLCGIAHRAIADWWRTSRRAKMADRTLAFAGDSPAEERLAAPSEHEPESAAIRAEQLDALRRGLAALPERERDALVLRFAGGLRATEVALVLGISAGATRMLLFRSLLKLKDWFARASSGETPTAMQSADVLDRAIDDVLARRGASIPDVMLERVVRFMAILHDVEVPPELPPAVRACIECEAEKPTPGRADPHESWFARLRDRLPATLRTVTVPACVICAAGPGVVPPLTALGLVGPAFAFHASSIVLAPLNLVVLWRRSRVHGDARGLLIGAVGAVLILVHMSGHIASLDDVLGLGVQDALIVGGTWLLMLGWFIDWRATRRIALAWRPSAA